MRRARLAELREQARGCERCPQLAANRTTVVFGSGDPDADLLLVGEAPGQNEDRQGQPMVGAPGRLLVELLGEIGIRRDEVYVANVLKCRPPHNRDPLTEEIEHCRSYLEQQLLLIQPKVVCALGNFATKLLRDDPAGIRAVHGQVEVRLIGQRAVWLLPLFHPAAALYQRSNLDLLREDLARVPPLLDLPAPPQPEPRPEPRADDAEPDDVGPSPDANADSSSGPARPDDVDESPQLGLF